MMDSSNDPRELVFVRQIWKRYHRCVRGLMTSFSPQSKTILGMCYITFSKTTFSGHFQKETKNFFNAAVADSASEVSMHQRRYTNTRYYYYYYYYYYKPSGGYSLRERVHNFVLPNNTNSLSDHNFLNRILYKNIF